MHFDLLYVQSTSIVNVRVIRAGEPSWYDGSCERSWNQRVSRQALKDAIMAWLDAGWTVAIKVIE